MKKNLTKKVVSIGLMCLFIAMSFAIAEDSIGPYNPIADVNRDGRIDILDLVEVGQAYGAEYIPITQPNKTTVTVLSFENNNFSFAENALVAVFPQGSGMEGQWKYTNSSGTVAFDLSTNSSYIAIAWDSTRSSYNYANFTTNSKGEASMIIWLNYFPEASPIRSIPRGWILMTILDNNTGEPYTYDTLWVLAKNFTVSVSADPPFSWSCWGTYCVGLVDTGLYAVDSSNYGIGYDIPFTRPNVNVAVTFEREPGGEAGNCTFRTDEYGGAYVVATIYRYW